MNRGQVTSICGVVGGTRVYDPVSHHLGSQDHGAKGGCQWLLIPRARLGQPGRGHDMLLVWWRRRHGHEGRAVGGRHSTLVQQAGHATVDAPTAKEAHP
jgi:hypothetical protein